MQPAVPTPERLLALVDRLAGQPVLMLVDLVADRFISGTPKRISREAPVLILRHDGEDLVPGGGANAVANIARARRPAAPGRLRRRRRAGARAARSRSPQRGIPTDGILVRPRLPHRRKTRILAGARHAIKQQIVRFDVEEPRAARPTPSGPTSTPAGSRDRRRRARWPCSPTTATAPSIPALARAGCARPSAAPASRICRQPLPARRASRARRRHAQRGGGRGAARPALDDGSIARPRRRAARTARRALPPASPAAATA